MRRVCRRGIGGSSYEKTLRRGRRDLSPKINTTLADSGITFSLFYVAHYRGSSTIRNRINRRLIAELESRPQIQLAYHTLNLLHAPNTPGIPSA